MDVLAGEIIDIGPQPQAFDIERATRDNANYRSVAWSGRYLQVTLMSIPVGGDIGLEAHPETDQFLRLDAGRGRVQKGSSDGVLIARNQWSDTEIGIETGLAPLRRCRTGRPFNEQAQIKWLPQGEQRETRRGEAGTNAQTRRRDSEAEARSRANRVRKLGRRRTAGSSGDRNEAPGTISPGDGNDPAADPAS
ncbi:hypothetical protein [Bradyrhizobium sp. HKCCYLR1023]|uniref:hypothetical protein n=1 Tax=Bradyrhizobium TaxID=374 RepID=UPI003EBF3D7F